VQLETVGAPARSQWTPVGQIMWVIILGVCICLVVVESQMLGVWGRPGVVKFFRAAGN
jgi:hypothetical protein